MQYTVKTNNFYTHKNIKSFIITQIYTSEHKTTVYSRLHMNTKQQYIAVYSRRTQNNSI